MTGNPEVIAEFSFPEWWINFNPTLIAAQKRGSRKRALSPLVDRAGWELNRYLRPKIV